MKKPPKEILVELYLEKKQTIKQIAGSYEVSTITIRRWLKAYNIPSRGQKQAFKDIKDQEFGRLTAKRAVDKGSGKATVWECECKCGNIVHVVSTSLRYGSTESCGCLRHDKLWQGYKDISGCYWNRLIRGAQKRKLVFEVEIENVWELFELQNGRCAISGLPIQLVKDYTNNRKLNTASLDRIDNSKGYIQGNIQWVHREINMMRRNMSMKKFLYFCRTINQYNDSKSTIQSGIDTSS